MIKLVMTMMMMMMSLGLLPTEVVLVASQTHPDNSGVFAAENVRAFALHQIELFVTDCEAWADTFAWNQSAKFCDGYVKEVSTHKVKPSSRLLLLALFLDGSSLRYGISFYFGCISMAVHF